MTKPKFCTRWDRPARCCDNHSDDLLVERTGYVEADRLIREMAATGLTMKENRDAYFDAGKDINPNYEYDPLRNPGQDDLVDTQANVDDATILREQVQKQRETDAQKQFEEEIIKKHEASKVDTEEESTPKKPPKTPRRKAAPPEENPPE